MFRNRAGALRYEKYMKDNPGLGDCPFCDLSDKTLIVEELKHCFVRRNVYPYTFWDYHDVVEHLMVIPRRHVHSLSELSSTELKEYVSVLQKYEKNNYDIYARSMNNKVRSAPHQHTHLIKTDSRVARAVFYLKRPRLLKRFF